MLAAGVLAAAVAGCADDAAVPSTGGGGAGGVTASTGEGAGASTTAVATVVVTGAGGAGDGGGGDAAGGGGAGLGGSPPACGDGRVDPGEACDDGDDDRFDGCRPDCTAVDLLDTPPLTWTWVEVPGTRCMNGETAGFGVSMAPDAEGLVIYLEGGGACFNDACDVSSFAIPFVSPSDGIFNRANPGNPVASWSMVYVPYCTGDIHGGDAETEVAGELRQFRGYANVGAFLERWVPSFPHADTVLLTGISAGGFGAGLNFQQVSDAFGPGRQMVLVDDSGPPLSREVIAPCLQQTFRAVWGLDGTILAACGADCPDPDDFASGWLAHLASRYPDARMGVFSNTADLVIRGFMGFGWSDGAWNDCEGTASLVPADVYEADLLALRATHEDRAGTFLVGQERWEYNAGRNHTVLRSPSFWTTVIDGTSVADWLGTVLAGEVVHVGP